jgi:hypothetical protein
VNASSTIAARERKDCRGDTESEKSFTTEVTEGRETGVGGEE